MLEELLQQLRAITAEAKTALSAASTPADVEAVKNRTLGRNGAITALSPMMGKLPAEDKKAAGMAFNEAKQGIQAALNEANARINAKAAEEAPAVDVTLPGRMWPFGRKHPISQTIDACCSIFRHARTRISIIATSISGRTTGVGPVRII